jgi:acetyl esterase/lipase
VHLSNIYAREPWRSVSLIAPAVVRSIFGRGSVGYRDALRLLANRAASPWEMFAYGDHPEQVMDLRLATSPPPAGPTRVAVFLHGGFWRREWGRDTIDTLAADLAGRGWSTANVEYRRLGCDGGWPITGDDVATAVDRVVDLTGTDRVTIVGHSSGGQLALVAGRAAPAEAVVALAPITDLRRAIESGIGAPSPEQFVGGADPAGPVSPITDPAVVPHLVVHGTGDDVVPVDFSTRYVEAAAGTEVTAAYPDIGHFSLLSLDEPGWALVTDWLSEDPGLRPTPPPAAGTG